MFHTRLSTAAAGLSLILCFGCGGTSSPTADQTSFQIVSVSVSEGEIWKVNRPIDIVFNEAIQPGSAFLGNVLIEDSNGDFPVGELIRPVDGDGNVLGDRVRFVPACPLSPGDPSGFQAGGVPYKLTVLGDDTPNNSTPRIRSLAGETLAQSSVVNFVTPTSTDPLALYHDPVPGPPGVRILGGPGTPMNTLEATYLESTMFPVGRTYFVWNPFIGAGVFGTNVLMDGLPLNHYSERNNQVAFVVHFNQPISPSLDNLERVRIEYLMGSWRTVPCRVQLLANCTDTGAALRVKPLGMLPKGTSMRIGIGQGFADLVGEAYSADIGGFVSVMGTTNDAGIGVKVDALQEDFLFGVPPEESWEDTNPDFSEPRALWGQGSLIPVFGTDGKSRARSKWIPLGLGHVDPGSADHPPEFMFTGTDATGLVQTTNGAVPSAGPTSGPVPALVIGPRTITVNKFDLAALDDAFLANPGILQGFRAILQPLPGGSSDPFRLDVSAVQDLGNVLQIELPDGCTLPTGVSADCVPRDLAVLYPGMSTITVEIQPEFFEIVTAYNVPIVFERDRIPADAQIRILFDACMADPHGDPDPATALSANGGWRGDIADLSGTVWDFVRFEVQFDLDVSGDGWLPSDPVPVVASIALPFDMR